MSSTSSPDLSKFIERGVEMLQNAITLFPGGVYPPTDGTGLVTAVLAQEPPMDQSPNTAVLPIIYVGYSKNPIRRMDYIGRDSADNTTGIFTAGAKTYHLEFYNVIITRGITKEASLKQCQQISNIVRDIYQKNLTMTDPNDISVPRDTQIAATNEVIAVPFILRTDNNTIQAINVICRPQQEVSLR